jgi:hypothetical protein
MPLIESTIIPLDDAHELLSAFEIGPYSNGYQRARRDDGFLQIDLEGVLDESGLVLGIDWRGWLQENVDLILQQLAKLDISATASLDEGGNEGTFHLDGKGAFIKYVPTDEDSFDEAIAAINRLIGTKAHYKKFRSCEGSDGWVYALLMNDDWNSLHSNIPQTMALIFKDVFVS